MVKVIKPMHYCVQKCRRSKRLKEKQDFWKAFTVEYSEEIIWILIDNFLQILKQPFSKAIEPGSLGALCKTYGPLKPKSEMSNHQKLLWIKESLKFIAEIEYHFNNIKENLLFILRFDFKKVKPPVKDPWDNCDTCYGCNSYSRIAKCWSDKHTCYDWILPAKQEKGILEKLLGLQQQLEEPNDYGIDN